eukprot:TRINITY_DN3543_c0_g1_i4.p2 TRINITY_DN3543_c0_g1~~TRINITY_DN3543_c0_g1_i4.p2  ORF type:complete len:152 (+),score=44.64 TRINITY_DN3543_c0_g1_i4:64-456(+)
MASKPTAFDVDIKGEHQAGQSPPIKHRLEQTSPRGKTQAEIDSAQRVAEFNRERALGEIRDKAHSETEKVKTTVERNERDSEEMGRKLDAKLDAASSKHDQHIQSIKDKNAEEVAHAKEVAARVKASPAE